MFRRFMSYYRPYCKTFAYDMLCSTFIALSGVIFPIVIRYLTQTALRRTDYSVLMTEIFIIVGILLLLYLIRSACQYYVSAQGHILGAHIETDMRSELFSHMEKLSFSFYDQTTTGHLISRILNDLFDITELAHHGPETVLLAGVQLVGAFIFLLTIDIPVTMVLLVVTILMFAFSLMVNKQMQRTFRENRKRVADINAVAQDSLSGIRTVVSFTNEEVELKKFEHNNRRFLNSKIDNYHVMGRFVSINGFLQGLMYCAVILAGGLAVAGGRMNVSDIVIYILYIGLFIEPVKSLINFTEQFQKGWTGFERMCEILDTEPEISDRPNAVEASNLKGTIEFDRVSFAYEQGDQVLSELCLKIEARKTVALVGPSGAGKSTFCSLIPRFYEVTDGAVRVDGRDVRDYTLRSLRSHIGVVQQDVYIFNCSVRDNISYGKPEATDEEIIEAARRANIHDFIMSLPEAYNTFCGEHGVRFSGGQKQRISIARVFLQNPPILILDEATSALDNESEVFIQNSLDELSKNRTTLVIAHRLSTIRNASRILVLTEDGIAEDGNHEALMQGNGIYRRLYELQFAGMEKN